MKRLKEPSTWAGFAAIAAMLSSALPGNAGIVAGGVAAVCGSLAAYLQEGGNA